MRVAVDAATNMNAKVLIQNMVRMPDGIQYWNNNVRSKIVAKAMACIIIARPSRDRYHGENAYNTGNDVEQMAAIHMQI